MPNMIHIRPLTFVQMVSVFNQSSFLHWNDLPYRYLSESWYGIFEADTLCGWAGLRGCHGVLCVVTLEAPDLRSQSMLLAFAIEQAAALHRTEMGFNTNHLESELTASITRAATRTADGLRICPVEAVHSLSEFRE